ncbi:Leucine-rich repeat extensin-like protein 3 [Abeliophyllum distichum]|uniref:Leucine-rich repeat extensin-like protein 3 n=1 Tax=Abeliophyllum distichum TaxID=126358 RepID=A0ABD1V5D3_9LAMI
MVAATWLGLHAEILSSVVRDFSQVFSLWIQLLVITFQMCGDVGKIWNSCKIVSQNSQRFLIGLQYVFSNGKINFERLKKLAHAVENKRLVLDLSCTKKCKKETSLSNYDLHERSSRPIHEDLFNKQQLEAIFLRNNQLDSEFPQNLGNSPAYVINLANNKYTGNIPFSLGYIGSRVRKSVPQQSTHRLHSIRGWIVE